MDIKKTQPMLNIQNVRLSLLKPWEDNPRINDEAVDALVKSIEFFGFNVPLLCDQEFNIIAGHTRWKAAEKIGMEFVPVIVLEISETQRKAFAVADNKTAEIADWDYQKLRNVLDELKSKKINLPSLGYCQAELQALFSKQRQFDWKEFQERMKTNLVPKYTYFPVKIPFGSRDKFTKAVHQSAKLHKIKNGDVAVLSGQVLAILLGIDNGKDTVK